MDDTILNSDVRESVVNELLKQNVILNHKTPHWFDSFFWNPEISSSDDSASKGESLKQPVEEHPSKVPNIQTPNSNIKSNSTERDFQSPCFNRN